jgi:hypothetical protein
VILRIIARVLLAMMLALTPAIDQELWQGPWQAIGPTSQASPFVRPEFAREMDRLRPEILEAARRHNRPELSGMSDAQFAAVIAQLLYNEHFGWLEDAVPPVRGITPAYQWAQSELNSLAGADLTVWPANLRPSVAVEILRGELPLPQGSVRVPVRVAGSQLDVRGFADQAALYEAVNAEISTPELAVEYLAANLERGLYRAHYENVPLTWQTLAAWHNQGIVRPADIQRSPAAQHYIRRASAYRAPAEALVGAP